MKINTKDWKMGHYPMVYPEKDLDGKLDDLEMFGHHKLVNEVRKLLADQEGCTCSKLVWKSSYRCRMHPNNKARTFDERYEFEQAWDSKFEKEEK